MYTYNNNNKIYNIYNIYIWYEKQLLFIERLDRP